MSSVLEMSKEPGKRPANYFSQVDDELMETVVGLIGLSQILRHLAEGKTQQDEPGKKIATTWLTKLAESKSEDMAALVKLSLESKEILNKMLLEKPAS